MKAGLLSKKFAKFFVAHENLEMFSKRVAAAFDRYKKKLKYQKKKINCRILKPKMTLKYQLNIFNPTTSKAAETLMSIKLSPFIHQTNLFKNCILFTLKSQFKLKQILCQHK